MYDILAMLKPDASFTVDELHTLVADVVKTGTGAVTRKDNQVCITAGSASLDIAWANSPYVLVESNEIAERFGIPCHSCRSRLEMSGDDPDMELFNDYLIINERLQATEKFIIFDPEEGTLLFE